jgi:plastocyanin
MLGLLVSGGLAAAAPVEDVKAVSEHQAVADLADAVHGGHGRELFPMLIGQKCAKFCDARAGVRNPIMSGSTQDSIIVKGPVKALEMLALNEDLNTLIESPSMCTRRHAMARAAGLASGLALAVVNAPGYAAETKSVKMGSDNGQLVFVPDELKLCKGDTVTWTNNKGGPHNVVFDEEAMPDGVESSSVSMPEGEQLADEGATFSMKFEKPGKYGYYCEPHRGAGMQAELVVS